jgi:hypothetical protein
MLGRPFNQQHSRDSARVAHVSKDRLDRRYLEMPNGTFPYTTVEIAPIAKGLKLGLAAQFYEDELGEVAATSIVYSGETYYVKVSWWFAGNLALMRHFCGEWQVKIDLESIGTAKEYSSALVSIPMNPCKLGTVDNPYTYTFALTPGTVDPADGGTVYLVAVTLSTLDVCGDPGHIWGYATGPSVMFVQGSPHD